LNSHASIEDRLNSLEKYSDLANYSEFFRKKAERVLDLSEKKGLPQAIAFRNKIQKGREVEVPYCPSSLIL